jgi:hypothetical protein
MLQPQGTSSSSEKSPERLLLNISKLYEDRVNQIKLTELSFVTNIELRPHNTGSVHIPYKLQYIQTNGTCSSQFNYYYYNY